MRAISSDLSRRVPEALVEHVVDLSVVAVAEPEGEEPECVLEAVSLLV